VRERLEEILASGVAFSDEDVVIGVATVAAIVDRAGSDVPRVEVAAHDNYLFRLDAPAHLRNDVGGIGVRPHLGRHRESDARMLAPRAHASEPCGVLRRDGRGRDPRYALAIREHPGVRRPEPVEADRSDEHRQRTDLGRLRGAVHAVGDRWSVALERLVEDDDLAACLGGVLFLMPLAGSIPTLAILAVVLGAGTAMVSSMIFGLLATELPADRRSAALNLVYLPLYAAGTIGPAAGAVFASISGVQALFVVGGGVFLFGAATILLRRGPVTSQPATGAGSIAAEP